MGLARQFCKPFSRRAVTMSDRVSTRRQKAEFVRAAFERNPDRRECRCCHATDDSLDPVADALNMDLDKWIHPGRPQPPAMQLTHPAQDGTIVFHKCCWPRMKQYVYFVVLGFGGLVVWWVWGCPIHDTYRMWNYPAKPGTGKTEGLICWYCGRVFMAQYKTQFGLTLTTFPQWLSEDEDVRAETVNFSRVSLPPKPSFSSVGRALRTSP